MEWVVTTGRSLEEATEAALDELGVDEDELDIEVLEEPRPGLFGRVRGEAKIRARVKPTTPRPKVDRRDRRRRNGGGKGTDDKGRSGGKAAAAAPSTPAPAGDGADTVEAAPSRSKRASSRSSVRDEPGPEPTPEPQVEPTEPAGATPGGDLADTEPTPPAPPARRRRGAPGRADRASTGDDVPRQEGEPMSTVSVAEQVNVMQEFLEGLLDAFDLDGEVSVVAIDDETSELQIEGDDLGLLIGPKGQTLSALQDLSRTVAQRRLPGSHEGRVRVDVSGYRQRRRVALERFARQVADDVRESGAQKVLEPMNAADRKVVHDVINDIEGVTTTSEGEDPRRRVVVLPAD